jgi:hypothetical protein
MALKWQICCLALFPQTKYIYGIKEENMTAVKPEIDTIEGCIYGDDCPFHAENPPFNAKALAAIEEARAIMWGDIPAK